MRLGILPRIKLGNMPTPLQELKNLSAVLAGPRILVKRDDLTGLAFGGNKTRKLEYLMADALSKSADYIVTGAGFQSNWCTQAAAAARKLGMKISLINRGPDPKYDPLDCDGNHLLHILQGAEIQIARPEDIDRIQTKTIEELRAAGHRPYLLTDAGSTPPGVAGYVNAMLELTQQSVERGIKIDYLVHASGSGGTQAGLIIGAKAFDTGMRVIGATTGSRSKKLQRAHIEALIDKSLSLLDCHATITDEDLVLYDQYAGNGYGYVTEGKLQAIKLLAETEGMFLDPVYTGTAMACLIDLCKTGYFKREDTVVFLHTGGAAALFPYKVPLKNYYTGGDLEWEIPPWSP